MEFKQAANAGSAPENQTLESANQAAAANGSAPLDAANQTENSANVSASEPEVVLGDKGVEEIKTLRKRAQGAETDAAYWRGIAEGRSQQPPVGQPPVAQPDGPPDQTQFENWDDFLIAKAKWEFKQDQVKQGIITRRSTNSSRFQQGLAKASEKDPEIMRAVRSAPAPSEAMVDAILESESSAEIAIHLATHPDDYARIMSLPSAYAQAKEIGKIEAKLSTASAPVPVKHISQAPEPFKAVGGGGSSQPVDLEKVPIDDFMASRNAAQYGRRK